MSTILIEQRDRVTHVTLDRADVRNAFNEQLVADLERAFASLPADTRAVVLAGAGKAFCAGADLAWMQRSAGFSQDQNLADALTLQRMFRALDECPVPVIARVHGPALGGGMGLISCCDVVLATPEAKFGFTEVKLGIAPAVISPFVLRKIGASAARRYFLTGELFDAETALRLGLVHEVVPAAELDARIGAVVEQILSAGPQAVRAAKRLIAEVEGQLTSATLDYTARLITELRSSPEGREGLAAFLEKRKAGWT